MDDRRPNAIVLVVDDDEVVLGHIVGERPDLTVVETLARVQLVARRLGYTMRLRNPCPRIGELLDLVGLREVLTDEPLAGRQPRRQLERRKEPRVEEVVEPGDPAP